MKLETHTHSQHHAELACPRCGQNAVVQHGSVYHCLNCNFRRNVSHNDGDDAIVVLVLLTIFAFIISLMIPSANAPDEAPEPAFQSPTSETVG